MDKADSLITEHIDIWTSAIKNRSSQGRGSNKKIELTGIKKLRELILELAVRGQLVPQDPNDEPAAVLLEKIAAEKAQLIKDKKIKKAKVLPEISEGEKPFGLPNGWEWARLGDLVEVLDQLRKPISKNNRIEGPYPYYGTSGVVDYVADYIFDEQLVLIGEDGAKWGSGEKTAFKIKGKAWINNHVHVVRCIKNGILDEYLVNILTQQNLQQYITGITVPKLNQARLISIVLPIPSIQEQHRIVAKVDELMALCDQLEQQTEDSITAHKTLVETLLTTLTSSENSEAFNQSWTRIAAHFDTLFTTEHSIDQLKQTVLQLAVMGKLVPQDPNDEPASVLLKKIAAEKEQLIKDKKIKKQKVLPTISEDEKPFELPNGWIFCRLAGLLPQFQNGASSRGDSDGKEIVVLRLADIKDWHVSMADTRSIVINEKSIERYLLQQGDVLIIRVNGSADIVGRFIICHENYSAIYCDHFIRMRFPIDCFSAAYLSLLGSSALIRERISDLFVSTAGQKTVNQTHIGSLCVTLPPLAEQHRIVKKVDELLSLCDQLKARLSQAQTTQLQLADTLVKQAVN